MRVGILKLLDSSSCRMFFSKHFNSDPSTLNYRFSTSYTWISGNKRVIHIVTPFKECGVSLKNNQKRLPTLPQYYSPSTQNASQYALPIRPSIYRATRASA